jgi:septation ring formation regulator EzrA
MGEMTPVTLGELMTLLAAERSLRLTDPEAIYTGGSAQCNAQVAARLSSLEAAVKLLPSETESLVTASAETIARDVVLERVNAVPAATQELLAGSLSAQNQAVVEKISAVNATVDVVKASVAEIPGLITGLKSDISGQMADVKSGINQSITNLNKVVDGVKTQLDESLLKLNSDLSTTTNNVKLAVIDSMKTMDTGITTSLSQLKAGTEAQMANLSKSLGASISQVQGLIDNPSEGLIAKLKTANATIDACSTRLSKMVSDIEQSDSIKDIRTKVSAYHDCYGQLLANLTLLESQCVTGYKNWMDEAEKAASRQLDVADTLDQVTTRMALLNEHESKLEYIIGQFDKMVILSDAIGALSALWASDHEVIQQFNEIVKSQKTFNATLAAANIGTALSGAAAAVTAAKAVVQKPEKPEVY